MSLTVNDILEKTFKRAFKGYDEDDVDQFLDQVIEEMKALGSRISVLEKELAEAKEKSSKVKETEEAIMHTMVSAQKSSERILNEAARKAELLIDNAENTAKKRKMDTDAELADAERKLEAIKLSAQKFATSFANMVNAQAASFDQAYQAYFGDIDAFSGGVLSAKALERIDEELAQNLKEIALSETEGHVSPGPEETVGFAPEPEAPPEKKELEPPRFVIDETQKPDFSVFENPEAPRADEMEALDELAQALEEPEAPKAGDADLEAAQSEEGWLSLQEINQVLSRMEDEGGDILQDSYSETESLSIEEAAQQAPAEDAQPETDEAPEPEAETGEETEPEADEQAEPEADVEPEADAEAVEQAETEADAEAAADGQEEPEADAPQDEPKDKNIGLGKYKQKYDDYSWLYENDAKADTSEFELSFKDPKEKEELKSLIDEVID